MYFGGSALKSLGDHPASQRRIQLLLQNLRLLENGGDVITASTGAMWSGRSRKSRPSAWPGIPPSLSAWSGGMTRSSRVFRWPATLLYSVGPEGASGVIG